MTNSWTATPPAARSNSSCGHAGAASKPSNERTSHTWQPWPACARASRRGGRAPTCRVRACRASSSPPRTSSSSSVPTAWSPNVAKYAGDQVVVGVNSVPQSNAGVLVRCTPDQGVSALGCIDAGADLRVDQLTMVRATSDDSRTITALNEVFIGHPSHQSARYELSLGSQVERQSSSGVVVSTGTGGDGVGRLPEAWPRDGGVARADLVLARLVRA